MRVLVTAFLLASVFSGAQTQQATTVEGKSTLSAPDPAAKSSNTYFARETA